MLYQLKIARRSGTLQQQIHINKIKTYLAMLKKSFFAVLMLGALACGNNQETSTETNQEVMQQHEAVEAKYTPDMVVNEKDYTCGMPVTAGISDTCHYEGKAYGFCSSECMAEFKKDPAAAIAKK
jgi:YHS domain-containing protein